MKKKSIIGFIMAAIIFAGLVSFGIATYMKQVQQEATELLNESYEAKKEKLEESESLEKETVYIQSGLGTNPNRSSFLSVMHRMTIQKVDSPHDDAIPMSKANIAYMKKNFNDYSKFNMIEDEADMVYVALSRWEKGDWSHIVEEHNKFYSLSTGQEVIAEKDKATIDIDDLQEQTFIVNEFDEKEVIKWKNEWDPKI